MRKSDAHIWIGLAGLFITSLASTAVLSFKIGVVNEKVTTIEKTVEKTTEDISKMKTDITEMKLKIDVLWKDHLLKSTPASKNDRGH